MKIDILSLFPGYFQGPFHESILKRAIEKGIIAVTLVDIRDFADNRHRKVDDRPYGGGPGMVMMPQPVVAAIRHVRTSSAHVIHLSPRGKRLTAKRCRQLSEKSHLIFLCSHYEGLDQRAIDLEVDEEISIGDYVLTNGCLAAIVVIDGVIRFIPGVLGHDLAADQDSFENGRLDWPHYTRPFIFEQMQVPEVLTCGDHKKIANWRLDQAMKKTEEMRPDLLDEI